MPVPTHKPGCETLHFRPAHCNTCNQVVTYWACSCGASVLFDAVGKPWPKHRCGDPSNVKFISTYTYGVSSVVCMRCGKTVRKRDIEAHNYYTHQIGKKPKPATPPDFAAENARGVVASARKVGYTGAGKPLVACPRCGAKVLQKNLQKHLSKKCPTGKQ